MKLTLVTCTGDRPEAFALCERWMRQQTIQYHQWIVIDDGQQPTIPTMGQEVFFRPEFRGPTSLILKLRWLFSKTHLVTGDAIVFIEDDDAYLPQYLELTEWRMLQADLVGEGKAVYYNVRDRWWHQHPNMKHASLCQTAIMRNLWPVARDICLRHRDAFVDVALWRSISSCPQYSAEVFEPVAGTGPSVIGIKGMPGRGGYGIGHRRLVDGQPSGKGCNRDPHWNQLKAFLGKDAQFYIDLFDPTPVKKVSLEVHIITYNEEDILPYTLRHYLSLPASRIVIHDSMSTDRTRKIALAAGVEVVDFDMGDVVNDQLMIDLKNNCWKGTTADWVICCDADELYYFPGGIVDTLAAYEQQKVAVVKPEGWDMTSKVYPTTIGQIYDEVKHGMRDDHWWAKPGFFNPRRVREMNFSAGAHTCRPVLRNGMEPGNPTTTTQPVTKMLHFKHIGPVERIAQRMDTYRARLSPLNVQRRWGNLEPGTKHAADKRTLINSHLQQVLP